VNKKLLIDTDVLIDFLRGDHHAIHFLEKAMEQSVCFLSVITISELYAGVREGKESHILERLILEFEIAALDDKTAQAGGLYRRKFGKSHGVGLADAIIAATADAHNLDLVTLNAKHYPMFKEVHVPYRKHLLM